MVNSTSFYTESKLRNLGFKAYGKNVLISNKASFYGIENISLGNNVRIDDFCVLSGKIEIGSYVHIAAFCGLFGEAGIIMEDFSGLSSRVSVYSVSDNFIGKSLTNPTVPKEYRVIEQGQVVLKKHSLVGSGAVLLPGSLLNVGSVLGALSLLKGKTKEWKVYFGAPANYLMEREKETILSLENKMLGKS